MNIEFNPELMEFRLYEHGNPTRTVVHLSEHEASVKNYAFALNRADKVYRLTNHSSENPSILVLPRG